MCAPKRPKVLHCQPNGGPRRFQQKMITPTYPPTAAAPLFFRRVFTRKLWLALRASRRSCGPTRSDLSGSSSRLWQRSASERASSAIENLKREREQATDALRSRLQSMSGHEIHLPWGPTSCTCSRNSSHEHSYIL